jgi:hypothetical protein
MQAWSEHTACDVTYHGATGFVVTIVHAFIGLSNLELDLIIRRDAGHSILLSGYCSFSNELTVGA